MQNKLKITAVIFTLLFAVMPFTAINANAQTFQQTKPSFGLYCEDSDADISGKVNFIIDENANAVRYSEYTVDTDEKSVYIPFMSNAYELPKADITVNGKAVTSEICYGKEHFNEYILSFYSSEIGDITGTLYTFKPSNENFTVEFTKPENLRYIYRFPENYGTEVDGKKFKFTSSSAKPDSEYEIFVINGEFTELYSDILSNTEKLDVKEYIARNFALSENYYAGKNITPELLYSLIGRAIDSGNNYDFFDFFIDSFYEQRINAFKIDLQDNTAKNTIVCKMPVDVIENNAFSPAIYMAEQKTFGNYSIDYSFILNENFPYMLESIKGVKKQGENCYAVQNVNQDFYFVFGSSKYPKSIYGDNKTDALEITVIVYAVLSFLIFASVYIISVIRPETFK